MVRRDLLIPALWGSASMVKRPDVIRFAAFRTHLSCVYPPSAGWGGAMEVRNMAPLDVGCDGTGIVEGHVPHQTGEVDPSSGAATPLADGEHASNPRPHDAPPGVAPLARTVRRMAAITLSPPPAPP